MDGADRVPDWPEVASSWACPGCGLVRPLEAVREAVALGVPRLECHHVPRTAPPAGRMGEAVNARRVAVGRGEVHPLAGGCGLLWVTHVGGRRVWAAEAEELAELLEGVPAGAVLH